MSTEQERWAEALAVEQRHGADGPRFIAERSGELAINGDWDGVERWREIAVRYDQLSGGQDDGTWPRLSDPFHQRVATPRFSPRDEWVSTIALKPPFKTRSAKAREPAWLLAARGKLGTREAPGPANNPTILGWAKRLGTKVLGVIYNADSVPWCGVFVGACLDEVGIDSPRFAVRAMSWATWGANLRPERVAPGAVLVFERPGGGHVGFYVGEDGDAYHVLGGNQGDNVTVARIDKSRCVARRWPLDQAVIGKPVLVAAGDRPLSKNEA